MFLLYFLQRNTTMKLQPTVEFQEGTEFRRIEVGKRRSVLFGSNFAHVRKQDGTGGVWGQMPVLHDQKLLYYFRAFGTNGVHQTFINA
jgi:hypothetical protein